MENNISWHMNFNLREFITKSIADFEKERSISAMWKAPLTAVLSAEHPLIPELKQAVSPDPAAEEQCATQAHLLPNELLPDAKSIFVFFIPFADWIVESNIKGEAVSEEWARAYIFTNDLLGFINNEIEKYLNLQGFQAAKIMATVTFDKNTLMSRWSHRHIARIAGLGSFGLNNMLITSAGCCGRFGSIVTNLEPGPNADMPSAIPDKCLHKLNGSCGFCLKKCKSGAIGKDRKFNRHKCYEICLKNAEIYKPMGMADVCGKCLVGLPCSSRDPSGVF